MLGCFVLIVHSGCFSHPYTSKDLIGEYIYCYKSGEVEVIVLNSDFSYEHKLYISVSDFKSYAEPYKSFREKWSLGERALVLDNWMLFADYSRLEKPRQLSIKCTSLSVVWIAPTRKTEAVLLVNEDIGYNFLRIPPWQKSEEK